MTCNCSSCANTRNRPAAAGDAADRIAAAVAERLSASVLQLPAEVADSLTPYAGRMTSYPLTPGSWPVFIETQVLSDGGLRLQLRTPDGANMFERTFTR